MEVAQTLEILWQTETTPGLGYCCLSVRVWGSAAVSNEACLPTRECDFALNCQFECIQSRLVQPCCYLHLSAFSTALHPLVRSVVRMPCDFLAQKSGNCFVDLSLNFFCWAEKQNKIKKSESTDGQGKERKQELGGGDERLTRLRHTSQQLPLRTCSFIKTALTSHS